MHPAFSVIFLTTLIGAAQGLFLAMFAGQVGRNLGLLGTESGVDFYRVGTVAVAVLLALGLLASFFHLGRPERFWRTATKWKTSWLSREVIALPAFGALAVLWGWLHDTGVSGGLSLTVGSLGVIAAMALFVCTGMIYASIRFIQEWASPITVINFTLIGSASGFLLAAAIAAFKAPELAGFYAKAGFVLLLLATALRGISLWRNMRLKPKSSLQTAIGMHHQSIKQTSQGAMGGSFNTQEYFHNHTEEAVAKVKKVAMIGGFAVPLLVLLLSSFSPMGVVLVLGFLVQYVGLVAERWFFFAQANHPQNMYYSAT